MPDRIRRALVTGASSGLGEAFARRLAVRGVDLVLVARDEVRLHAVAGELPVTVDVLPADLTLVDGLRAVEERLASHEHPVDLLVNNAGFGAFGNVADVDVDHLDDLISVNVTALVRLTHAVLPQLLTRRTGAVVQVGSVTAYQPNPGGATYGASKAFVRSFSLALCDELAGTGVRSLLVSPGSTRTRFHERAGGDGARLPEVVRMDPGEVAERALQDLARGRQVSIPGIVNRALTAGARIAPASVSARLAGAANRRLADAA